MKRPNIDIAPGTYRMRNGHTAVITTFETLTYATGKFVIWRGRCVECNAGLSWLELGRGSYGAGKSHPFDLMERVAVAMALEVAA